MSDSRRVYRAISQALKQLYPSEPQGNVARHLNTLAGMVTGIVLGKSCQLPILAAKAPDETLAESRGKRFGRWIQNETVTPECYFLPFIELLLTRRRRGAGAAVGLYYGWQRSGPRLFGFGDQRGL